VLAVDRFFGVGSLVLKEQKLMISTWLLAQRLRRSWRKDSFEQLQTRKLRAILHHAYRNVPFYHRKFEEAGIKPGDVRSLQDLSKIPTTTKSEIQASPVEDVIARGVNIEDCTRDITSGSSGTPLVTYMDKNAIDMYSAVWLAVFQENGVHLWDKRAIIGEPRNFPKRRSLVEYFGVMRRRHISIFSDVHTQLNVLRNFEPDIIEGYPSSLVILADAYGHGKDMLNPRLIFTLAEVLDGASREFISSTFKAELLDYYGSSEFSLLAWECRNHKGYHINADCSIVEFMKNGDPAGEGEDGEITCTTLVNYAMPLIRYRQGDVGVSVKGKCTCGRNLPMMRVVKGRKDDFLTAVDGRIISPTIFFPYPFNDFSKIRQFRVVQEKRDRLVIQLVLKDGSLANELLQDAVKEIKRVFGDAMQVEFEFHNELKRDSSGKLQKIVSLVPVSFV